MASHLGVPVNLKMRSLLIILAAISGLVSAKVQAAWLNYPVNYFTQYSVSSMTELGLGTVCLSILQTPNSRPCNPAFTPFTEKSIFDGHLLMGGDYSQILAYR